MMDGHKRDPTDIENLEISHILNCCCPGKVMETDSVMMGFKKVCPRFVGLRLH